MPLAELNMSSSTEITTLTKYQCYLLHLFSISISHWMVMAVELSNQLQHLYFFSPPLPFYSLFINFLTLLHFPIIKLPIPNCTFEHKQPKLQNMERFVRLTVVLAMAMVMAAPAYAQISSTPCSTSMINSLFNPCMNFLTNSSANGTSPTAECCNSIKSLTSGGMDCLCLIITGNVPFRIPINRTLAISLPRTCNLPRLPLQCKSIYILSFQSLFS